ncbi:MAG: hypothetical protein CMF04_11340 [Hyphomonas sp.]|nr:hypothetical protein [Hyphomonas sp.]|tara:strand:- start:6931 stop:7254 length:324 start_codon:yes stop_codon:yes gene_type:complete
MKKQITLPAYEFSKGDRVPDWLLRLEPNKPNSYLKRFTFMQDCVVVVWDNSYHMIPRDVAKDSIHIDGNRLTLSPDEKRVFLYLSANIFTPDGGGSAVRRSVPKELI